MPQPERSTAPPTPAPSRARSEASEPGTPAPGQVGRPEPEQVAWREPGRPPTTLLRAALRRRMLVLLVVLLGAAAVCARLGVWQLDRAQLRGQQAESVQVAEQQATGPARIGDVLAPRESFRGELVGRQVEVTGTYEAAGQLLVADRALDGRTGFLVLTPLRVTNADGAAGWSGADPALPVVRGWIADPNDGGAPLAVPAGPVTISGYLQVSEGSGSGGGAPGQTDAISSAELVNSWDGPIYSGYLVLVDAQPPQPAGLAPLGPPTLGGSGGARLNVQNLAYAAQWWIFGGFALFLWIRLVRDEAAGDRAAGDRAAGDRAAGDPADGSAA